MWPYKDAESKLESRRGVKEDELTQKLKNSTRVILKTEQWAFPLGKMYTYSIDPHVCDYVSDMLFHEKLIIFRK